MLEILVWELDQENAEDICVLACVLAAMSGQAHLGKLLPTSTMTLRHSKVYRPIALLDTMAKILSSYVAEDLVYMAKKIRCCHQLTLVVQEEPHQTCYII